MTDRLRGCDKIANFAIGNKPTKKMKLPVCVSAVALSLLTALTACSGNEDGNAALTKAEKAEIQAATIEGRNAAREFVNREWRDTIELMDHLLHVKAQQSRYLLDNKPRQAEAFDSGFISTVRAVDPQLADAITSAPAPRSATPPEKQ